MHPFRKLTATLVAMLSLSAASLVYGDSFTYSYTFENGIQVTGSLDGILAGNLITDISNVTVTVGGYTLQGTVFVESFSPIPSPSYVNGGAIVSLDGSYNNFLFINSDYANGDNSYSGYFGSIVMPEHQSNMVQAGSPQIFGNVVDQPRNTSWTVTAVVPVPDGSMTAVMLGIGLTGLVCLRRRKQ